MTMKYLKVSSAKCYLAGMALLLIGACNEQPKEETPTPSALSAEQEIEAPKEIISLDEAKVLCENYERRRIPSILEFESTENANQEKFIPTQFVAFKLETLKSYIKYVEQEAKKAKVTPDSLRIYLGNYGNSGEDPNRNTVFVLPTAQIGKGYGGFYIGDNGEAKLIRDYWPKEDGNGLDGNQTKSKASMLPTLNTSLMQGGGSLIMNRGNAGPPPFGDF